MTCSYDVHLVRPCVLFFAIIPCVALFDALFVSLSHSTCLAHPSERKGAPSVCHGIKRS